MRPSSEGETNAAERTALVFSQLRDVNEQLVLSAVRAQVDAEAAARQLDDVSRAAELDALTSLPNRALLRDRMTQALAIARRHDTRVAVLFLDLNNFKQINDTLGHAMGDAVLREAALSLLASVRAADTVSRQGGDEFVVLLTDIREPSDAIRTVEKLMTALGTPLQYGEHVVRLTASVGISLFPEDGTDGGILIDRADSAMYRAKRRGVSGYAFHADAHSEAERQTALRPALAERQVMHVQEAQAEQERRHDELREANEQLVLAMLGCQLVQQHAERAHQRQADFIAMLAHELRNPLAPMYNVAAMLSRVKPDDTTLPKLQAIIERQVGHMSRMVDDLLDVTRANTGKLRLELAPTNLETVFARSLEQRQAALNLRLQRVTTRLPAAPVIVNGDADRLVQVVSNLLDNASKYSPKGGDVGIALIVDASHAHITVSDSGIGITAEAMPAIFDLFNQDHHAIDFSGAGLGIGLTVISELVQAHGGTVSARSAGTGHGSEFTVSLPLWSARTAPSVAVVTVSAPRVA